MLDSSVTGVITLAISLLELEQDRILQLEDLPEVRMYMKKCRWGRSCQQMTETIAVDSPNWVSSNELAAVAKKFALAMVSLLHCAWYRPLACSD